MEEKNNIKKEWIKCSVIGFLIAFGVSMFFFGKSTNKTYISKFVLFK